MVRFSKLTIGPDGKPVETNIREIKQSDVAACPHCILIAEHYRNDGSCRCDDQSHEVMKEWGYFWDGAMWISEPPEQDGEFDDSRYYDN